MDYTLSRPACRSKTNLWTIRLAPADEKRRVSALCKGRRWSAALRLTLADTLLGQEFLGLAQEDFKLVVVEPVAGLVNLDDLSIGDLPR